MHRYFSISLASPPEVRTSGSFGFDESRLEWVQPRDVWQGLLVRHAGVFHLSGYSFRYDPFSLIIVPPGARCEMAPLGEGAYNYNYFSFCPVSADRDLVALPMVKPLGEEGPTWDINFRRALSRLQVSRTSIQAVAGAMLWSVAEPEHVARKSYLVEAAEHLIMARIGQEIRVSVLAKELNISQSQLTRQFLADVGRTPLQYIRDQKAQHAHGLLTTTRTPIKQIATACGFPDLHAFNRFVRDRLGASPRAVRLGREAVDVFRLGEKE